VLLVDTSAWIEFFRRADIVGSGTFPELDDVITCLPVIQEVLQGFRDEPAFLPIIESPLRDDVFLEAAGLYRQARRARITVRSSVDCLIATCATRHALTVLHHDRDFDALAEVSPLRCRRLRVRLF
jgi:predicted nucleic acid-binding protein